MTLLACVNSVATDDEQPSPAERDNTTIPCTSQGQLPLATTDEALLQAIGEKRLDALEEFCERHQRIGLALAYRVLEDLGLAEDVVQEAFLTVWRQPEIYKPERGAVRTWFLSIVRHRAIDYTRRRYFKQERLSLDQFLLEPRYADPWKEVSDSWQKARVRQAVDRLPGEQRQTVMLAYFGGYNQREISGIMGVPLGTVKGRMRLGMQKLRGLLTGPDCADNESVVATS